MHTPARRSVQFALLLAACGGPALARAADVPFAWGAVYGYGNGTNIYGVQVSWAPPKDNAVLEHHDLGLRLTAQLARWVARDSDAQYHSLTDANVMAELRYWLMPAASLLRSFVEAGFGFDLLSHVHIAERNITTAFNFGSQAAVGFTFGDHGRYEISALIHHASNARISNRTTG